jgi:prefoldin subunit 5
MDKPWHELNKQEQSELIRRMLARLDELGQSLHRLAPTITEIHTAIENLEKWAQNLTKFELPKKAEPRNR